MTKEELLKPRYKVVADYPEPKYYRHIRVGEIISNLNISDENYLKSFPNLFKKLEWWEERDEKDLPKYFRNDYGVHRIQKPIKEYAQHNWYIEPATEQEYNDYIKTKNK